jgi:hypothetical protein
MPATHTVSWAAQQHQPGGGTNLPPSSDS